jgi:dipeptidase D
MSVRELEPIAIWNHFEDLNAVPRASKKEERVRRFMLDFGKGLGLETLEDEIGNVVIKKAATAGMENRETIIIQSHIDMVHQKNSETEFDFSSQGIQSFIDGEWVKARGTTLGADNGMGVAAAMSLLSSTDIAHPQLEALFTIDEETGMTGAKHLDSQMLSGNILLNLDTEDDDEFSVGCAGGIDTTSTYEYMEEDVPASHTAFEVKIRGLKGGHSGIDIHLGRGNSNLLMNRLILAISKEIDVRISFLSGGSLRNAIPRETEALIVCDSASADRLKEIYESQGRLITEEYAATETDMEITIAEAKDRPSKMISKEDFDKTVGSVDAVPNGVWKMSDKFHDLVETSSSLARVVFDNGIFVTKSLQRSMIESGKTEIANEVRSTFEKIGATTVQGGEYPGWEPNPDSRILKVLEREYKEMFNEEPKILACHAGLECGILGEHLPSCDMISFGPTIRHPHSPDEKVNIPSVQKFWDFLLRVLEKTPHKN